MVHRTFRRFGDPAGAVAPLNSPCISECGPCSCSFDCHSGSPRCANPPEPTRGASLWPEAGCRGSDGGLITRSRNRRNRLCPRRAHNRTFFICFAWVRMVYLAPFPHGTIGFVLRPEAKGYVDLGEAAFLAAARACPNSGGRRWPSSPVCAGTGPAFIPTVGRGAESATRRPESPRPQLPGCLATNSVAPGRGAAAIQQGSCSPPSSQGGRPAIAHHPSPGTGPGTG